MDATTLSAVRFVAVQLLALSSVMWNDVAREQGPVKLAPGLLPANSADVVADLSSRLALASGATAPPSVGAVTAPDVSGAIPASSAQVAPPAVSVASVTPAAPAKAPPVAAGTAPAPPVHAAPAVAPVATKPGAVGRHKRSIGSDVVNGVAGVAGDVASSVIDHVGDVAHVTSVAADAASGEIHRNKRDVGNAIAEVADTISDVAGSCAGTHLPGRLCASVASAADAVENTVESDQRNIARMIL